MTSTLDICTLTLSKLGIAGGTKSPRQEDLDLAMKTLKSLYRHYIQSGTLGRARTTVLTEPMDCYVACENERILRAAEVKDVTLPLVLYTAGTYQNDDDYGIGTAACAPRPPKHGAFVVINDSYSGQTAEFIYDGYTNSWISIHDMDITTSNVPLASDLNGISARLATNLADHYDAELHPATQRDALLFDAALVQAFGESENTLPGQYF